MSGRRSRSKGCRREREFVNLHTAMGVHAERVPLSGACGGAFSGDIDVYAFGPDEAPLVGEVKARANGEGFKVLEGWMSNSDVLFLRRDRAEPMVVLPWRTWCRLIRKR
jgi:Holliday junction resolvase